MCKPQKKGNGLNPDRELGHSGFGKIRKLIHSGSDLKIARGFDPELLKACEGKDASDEDPKQWANRLANQIENFWD